MIAGGLQGQAGLRSWHPSSRHLPALVISARAYLHPRQPAFRTRLLGPGEPRGDPGATQAPLLEAACPCVGVGVFLHPEHRTCHIEHRREHDIDEEGATHRQQSRPETATTGLSFQLTLHILPSFDATVL